MQKLSSASSWDRCRCTKNLLCNERGSGLNLWYQRRKSYNDPLDSFGQIESKSWNRSELRQKHWPWPTTQHSYLQNEIRPNFLHLTYNVEANKINNPWRNQIIQWWREERQHFWFQMVISYVLLLRGYPIWIYENKGHRTKRRVHNLITVWFHRAS